MPIGYQARVYDTSGGLQAVITDFRSINIEHRVNGVSSLVLGIFDDPSVTQYFALDSMIEVRRQYTEAGLDWYTEFIGFHRTPQHQITSTDTRIFTSYARGLLDLINRRTVRYYADTDGSAKGPGPADDIIKAYVRENAGSLATISNRRVTDGVTPGLSIAPDLGQAPVWEGAHAWDGLLDAIQEIGEHNLVDFDVVWVTETTFEFRTYWPQQGTNRSSPTAGANAVIFSPEFGNVTDLSHTVSRTEEITSVLVLGPGEGPLRDTTLVTANAITNSPWNKIEQNHNLPAEDRVQAILEAGGEVLYEKRAAINFTFQPIQTPYSAYHRHYFLGDIVTARLGNLAANLKIRGVSINVSGNAESISLELEQETSEFA